MDNKYKTSNLNEADFVFVCKIIGADAFKAYYHEYSHLLDLSDQESQPSEITDEQAIDIAIRNRNSIYIIAFIDSKIKKCLSEIQETVDKHESAGDRKDLAYTKAILLSPFKKQIDLYFKLSGIPLQSPLVRNVKAIVSRVISKSRNSKENQLPIQEKSPITSSTPSEVNDEKLYEDIIVRYKKENADLEANLSECKDRIHQLEARCKKAEDALQDFNQNNGYDNDIIDGMDFRDSNQHLSLCEITEPDSYGLKWLSRLADINKVGEIIPFVADPNRPLNYQNRTKIYMRRNGEKRLSEPDLPGQIGVWHWDSSPSPDDPTKDYNTIYYHAELSPIAVIILSKCETNQDLIKAISSGVNTSVRSDRLIIAFRQDNGNLLGLLLKSHQYTSDSSGIKLKQDVITLPQYIFPEVNTVMLAKEKLYYKWVNISVPFETVPVKNPMEVVKQVILSRSSWSVVKERTELKKSNWQVLRNLLVNLDNTSVVDDIQTKLGCTPDEARRMLDRFLNCVDEYSGGISIEDQWLLALVSVNNDLLLRCQGLIREDWRKENEALLKEAEDRLSNIKDDIAKEEKKRTDLIKELEEQLIETKKANEEAQKKLDKINSDIHDAEVLASQVEEKVSDRIKAARTDAASFIAEMAFVSQLQEPSANSYEMNPIERSIYRVGEVFDSDILEICNSWKDTLVLLSECLEDAGVSNEYSSSLAAYLYSAYMEHTPLMLAGPNSSSIADALSYTLTGKSAGSLICLDP